jgi:Zn-dependent protease/CBS domain-containing protein
MSSLPIGDIAGIQVRIHASWAIILALIAATVATQAGTIEPAVTTLERWSIGVAVALGFLLSAIIHELAHAIVGRRRGATTTAVIVHFLGTVASPNVDVPRPRDEVAIGLAGPLATIAVGLVSLGITYIAELIGGDLAMAVAAVTLVVGTLDIAIGLLNLLPAYPLDGGRVMRALGWARTGDPRRGLRIAATVGRATGILVAVLGVVAIVILEPLDGLMIAVGGWFLVSAARGVERRAAIDDALDGVIVRDVMDRDVTTLPPGLTIDTFADQVLDGSAALAFPVVRGTELLGMIGAAQLRRVSRTRRATVRVEDVMVSPPDLPLLDPEATLQDALDGLAKSGLDGLPVIEDGRLAGLVMRRHVAAAVRTRTERAGISPW